MDAAQYRLCVSAFGDKAVPFPLVATLRLCWADRFGQRPLVDQLRSEQCVRPDGQYVGSRRQLTSPIQPRHYSHAFGFPDGNDGTKELELPDNGMGVYSSIVLDRTISGHHLKNFFVNTTGCEATIPTGVVSFSRARLAMTLHPYLSLPAL